MAKAAGVRVVPVSISNLHRWMPASALLPLAPARHVTITIHPPIETNGRSVREIKDLCFEVCHTYVL